MFAKHWTLAAIAALCLTIPSFAQDDKAGATIAKLQETLRQNPHDAEALKMLAGVYLANQDGKQAQHYGELAVQEKPNDALAWVVLGSAYLIQQDAERADRCADKALALTSESSDAYSLKGTILVATGKPAEAIAVFKSQLALVRKQSDSQKLPGAFNNLALALGKSGDWKTSLATAREGLAQAPSPQLFVTASKCCRSLADYQSALEYAQKGLASFPAFSNLYASQCLAYHRLNRKEEAEKAFAQVAKRDAPLAAYLRQVMENPALDR